MKWLQSSLSCILRNWGGGVLQRECREAITLSTHVRWLQTCNLCIRPRTWTLKKAAGAAVEASLPLSRNKYDNVATLLLSGVNKKYQGHTEPNYPALFPARITHSWFWQSAAEAVYACQYEAPAASCLTSGWRSRTNRQHNCVQTSSDSPYSHSVVILLDCLSSRQCQQCLFESKWEQKKDRCQKMSDTLGGGKDDNGFILVMIALLQVERVKFMRQT